MTFRGRHGATEPGQQTRRMTENGACQGKEGTDDSTRPKNSDLSLSSSDNGLVVNARKEHKNATRKGEDSKEDEREARKVDQAHFTAFFCLGSLMCDIEIKVSTRRQKGLKGNDKGLGGHQRRLSTNFHRT